MWGGGWSLETGRHAAQEATACINLVAALLPCAGEALKANITTLGPLVLPLSEQVLFAVNMLARKLLGKKKVRAPRSPLPAFPSDSHRHGLNPCLFCHTLTVSFLNHMHRVLYSLETCRAVRAGAVCRSACWHASCWARRR